LHVGGLKIFESPFNLNVHLSKFSSDFRQNDDIQSHAPMGPASMPLIVAFQYPISSSLRRLMGDGGQLTARDASAEPLGSRSFIRQPASKAALNRGRLLVWLFCNLSIRQIEEGRIKLTSLGWLILCVGQLLPTYSLLSANINMGLWENTIPARRKTF
jgi:hypothetical protein